MFSLNMGDVILRDFDGNTLSSALYDGTKLRCYPSDVFHSSQAFGSTASSTGNCFTAACAPSFSPLVVGRFFSTTRTCPRDKGLCIPQATISLNREHTYFSAQVSNSLINLRRCFTCCIIDGGRISVGLTPLSTHPRHPTISNTPAKVCRRRSTRRMRITHPVTHLFPTGRALSNACAPSRSLLPHIRPHSCSR
jgi:hypothetical protein